MTQEHQSCHILLQGIPLDVIDVAIDVISAMVLELQNLKYAMNFIKIFI